MGDDLYTDGGLLHTQPIDYINKHNNNDTETDLTIIIGYNKTYENKQGTQGTNALNYLARIIEIVRLNHDNVTSIVKMKNENENENNINRIILSLSKIVWKSIIQILIKMLFRKDLIEDEKKSPNLQRPIYRVN